MEKTKKHIYKRKDNRFEGRVLVGYLGIYGKAIYRSVYGHTEEEVEAKIKKEKDAVKEEVAAQQKLREGKSSSVITNILEQYFFKELTVSRKMTVGEWLVEWLEDNKKKTIRVTSYARYRTAIYNYILPELGNQMMTEVTPDKIQIMIHHMYNGMGKKRKLSPTTVHNYYNIFKMAFEDAQMRQIINRNPCKQIYLPYKNKKKPDYLDADEYKKLMGVLENAEWQADKAAVLVALKTGLRLGEITGLKWENIDFRNRTIHVKDSLQRIQTFNKKGPKTILTVAPVKTDAAVRDVPMNESQYGFFEKYLCCQQKKYNRIFTEDTYVFLDHKGKRMDPRVLQYSFKRILEEAKIRPVNFHSLRHTFATVAASKEMQISVLSRILGHTSVTLTLNRYVHTLTNQDRKEMAKIDWDYT